jgi:GNAT superfamily N-acetyltransferase
MVTIRDYRSDDAESVGCLIADTYSRFNLSSVAAEEKPLFLGPFQHARSHQESHKEAIAQVIQAAMVFVAEDEREIVGVLRGRSDKLQSLFVREDYHRRGVGRQLVERFERACKEHESGAIKVQATLCAVPFYLALGYKKTTGVRVMRSFEGVGLQYQPMKKVLRG